MGNIMTNVEKLKKKMQGMKPKCTVALILKNISTLIRIYLFEFYLGMKTLIFILKFIVFCKKNIQIKMQ